MKAKAKSLHPGYSSRRQPAKGTQPFFQKAGTAKFSGAFFQPPSPASVIAGRPGDPLESEAERIADAVTGRRPAPTHLQGKGLLAGISPLVQRQAEEKEARLQAQAEKEEEPVQAQAEKEEEEPVQAKSEKKKEKEEAVQAKAADEKEEEKEKALQAKVVEEERKEEPVQARKKEKEEERVQALAVAGEPVRAKLEKEEKEKGEGGAVQARPESESAGPWAARDYVHQQLRSRRGNGSPLPEKVRTKLEEGFGADFSGIRIHTGHPAVLLTRLLKAQAFTHGADIFFNQGRFAPGTPAGEHLLAHELTHTIQQGAVKPQEPQLQTEPGVLQRREEKQDTIFLRPELLEAIKLARGEIGRVNAQRTNADGTRVGWERLYEYFHTAFGEKEVILKDVIKFIRKARNQQGREQDIMPAWCGIFVWWAYKKAGIPIPDWQLGASILKWVKPRQPGELPRKGDIAYREKYQHFALVTGVEGPEATAGKDFKGIHVATVNGNTSGGDNLGGQIEEKWEPISRWAVFFDPVARLDLPPVPLRETGVEPEQGPAKEPEAAPAAPAEPIAEIPPTDVAPLEGEVITESAALAPEEAEIAVELPEPPAVMETEEAAEVEPVALEGTSDQAMVGFLEASPSQMAKTQPALGLSLDGKINQEKQHEAENAPVLVARTSGKVEEGLTPPEQIPVPGEAQITDGVTGAEPGELAPEPHQNFGEAPSNQENENLLDKPEEGGFLSWLRDNIKSFLARIRTADPSLNTRAGERPTVQLQGEADPSRMGSQRQEAQSQLQTQRDAATAAFKNHPGQQNIQPKEVNEEKTVPLSPEAAVTIETSEDPGAADYAQAPLPADVRAKADELLAPRLRSDLAAAKSQTEQAAQQRETDKAAEIARAEAEASKVNQKADQDQRDIVVGNRQEVARQQKAGIEEAYGEVHRFNQEADQEQTTARREIGEKVKDSEGRAHQELEKGEADAEAKKREGEREAEAKKAELDKAQGKKSWWDRAVGAIKNAVKAITKAIDVIFTKIREAVKFIIEKAKEAAIGLINAARAWIVDKLNKFRDWAKGMVNTYLKERFPNLAAKINNGIDAVVDVAIVGVNTVADAAIATVEALAKGLAAVLDKVLSVFQTALKAAVQIAGAVITGDFAEALRIAIQAACDIAGIDSKPIFDFMDRAAAQVMQILKAPGKFFNNLMAAVGGGVRNFAKNIKKHLINGLIGWLTGALSEVAITLPEKFDLKGIFSLVMQILGLTYENIKAKVIKRFPPAAKVFAVIEKGMAILQKLITEGPAALWEMARKSLANLKEMVLSGIRNFVITTVVKEAITWLLGLLNPAAAIVKIVKLLFDFVMFLIERFQQIKDFVLSVYNSISAIASGALDKATQAVEEALSRSLPVVISLLASLAGLGGIGKTVKNIVAKVSQPVHKLVNRLVDKIVAFAKKLLAKGKVAGRKVAEKLAQWWKLRKKFKAQDGAKHTLCFKGSEKSAILTVSSEEQTLSRFLNWAGDLAKSAEQKAALEQAKTLSKKIDQEKAAPTGGGTPEQKKLAAKEKQQKINLLMGELGEYIRLLFGADRPECGKPEYGSINEKGFGTKMEIKVLTKQGMPKGSKPTQAKHATYDILNKRRVESGHSYYIRGHLLNQRLGGPGVWQNMTPLSRKGNDQHESQVESLVKAAVIKAGAIMSYSVIPVYNARGDKDNLIKNALKERPAEAGALQLIISSEDWVPSRLECKAQLLEREGATGFREVKSANWPVENPIDRSLKDYHVKTA